MRTVLNKSKGVWRVIVPARKRSARAVPEKAMEEKSTISDTTVPVVWIGLGLVLSVVTLIAYDNRNEHD